LDVEDAKPVGRLHDLRRVVAEEARIERIRKPVILERRLRQHAALDDADVFVHAAVPGDAEHVAESEVADIFEETDSRAEFEDVVVDRLFRGVLAAEVSAELFPGILRELKMPRHVRRFLAAEHQAHNFAFRHRPTSIFPAAFR
jgi:hypothetical protein